MNFIFLFSACTTLNSPCYCQLQGADACSAISNSVCNTNTGACVCSALNPEVGGVCLDSLEMNGVSLSPFSMVSGSDVSYVSTAGSDNAAWGVAANGYYLETGDRSVSALMNLNSRPAIFAAFLLFL